MVVFCGCLVWELVVYEMKDVVVYLCSFLIMWCWVWRYLYCCVCGYLCWLEFMIICGSFLIMIRCVYFVLYLFGSLCNVGRIVWLRIGYGLKNVWCMIMCVFFRCWFWVVVGCWIWRCWRLGWNYWVGLCLFRKCRLVIFVWLGVMGFMCVMVCVLILISNWLKCLLWFWFVWRYFVLLKMLCGCVRWNVFLSGFLDVMILVFCFMIIVMVVVVMVFIKIVLMKIKVLSCCWFFIFFWWKWIMLRVWLFICLWLFYEFFFCLLLWNCFFIW